MQLVTDQDLRESVNFSDPRGVFASFSLQGLVLVLIINSQVLGSHLVYFCELKDLVISL